MAKNKPFSENLFWNEDFYSCFENINKKYFHLLNLLNFIRLEEIIAHTAFLTLSFRNFVVELVLVKNVQIDRRWYKNGKYVSKSRVGSILDEQTALPHPY